MMARPRNAAPSRGSRNSSSVISRASAHKSTAVNSQASARKSTTHCATSAYSHQRSYSSRPPPAKMQARLCDQTKPVHTSYKGVQKAFKAIEKETRGQRENPKWHDWRENRITASMAHKIANSNFVNNKSAEVPQSYLDGVMKRSSGFQTPAMSWGIENEKKAVQEYESLNSKNPRGGVKVEDCGLFIHPKKTWLAASPDGIVRQQSTGKPVGLLEVKCPYKHKDNTISDACKDDSFCLTSAGKSNALKKEHPYYTQVQCQMATTGLKKTDFVVHTNKETTITPVKFDSKFWKATEPKLEKFYNEAVVPHLENTNNNHHSSKV